MHHDVIVVGGGPAGSVAALHLARAGARTLLLERARLGRDKPCGGGLTRRAYASLEVPLADVVDARVEAVELRLGPRALARLSAPEAAIYMVRRTNFDRRLAEAAAAAGADLRVEAAATGVAAHARGVTVQTVQGPERASVLLLATGAESPLGAQVGFSPLRRALVAIELEGPAVGAALDGTRAVLDYGVPGGYAWAFPKGGVWNVGIGSTDPRLGRQLRPRLAIFLAQLGLRFVEPGLVPERAVGRRIPLWHPPVRLARERVALLGDAAGLADPFFGEGIASALASGRLAASAALAVLHGRSTNLDHYETTVQLALGFHLRRMGRIARLVERRPGLWIRALARLGVCRRAAAHVLSEPFRPPAPGSTLPALAERRARRA